MGMRFKTRGARFKSRSAIAAAACLLAPVVAAAACPSEANLDRGFAIDGGSAKSEVRHLGDHFVQATTRYPDGVVQTDLYHDGLFAISRVSARGATMMYQAGLEDWRLEMKPGAKASVTYIPLVDSKPLAQTTVELEVKGSETLQLGACSYTVFVISETRQSGQGTRQYDQLYAPLLKFVVARRYPDGETKAYRGVEVLN
ncbi:MAG: hypothetical protein ACFB13_06670 [Kiloniellaceae bacterium]